MPWIALGAGLAALGTAVSVGANNKATKVAQQTAADNNALARENRDLNVKNLNPFLATGTAANTAYGGALGLNGDNGYNKLLEQVRASPGYQFGLKEGVGTITGNAATRGLLKSGSTLKALDKYGQGYAETRAVNPFLDRLQSLSQQGLTAGGDIAGVGNTFVNSTTANNDSAASVAANSAVSNGNAISGLLGQAVGALGQYSGSSSYGSGSNSFLKAK